MDEAVQVCRIVISIFLDLLKCFFLLILEQLLIIFLVGYLLSTFFHSSNITKIFAKSSIAQCWVYTFIGQMQINLDLKMDD